MPIIRNILTRYANRETLTEEEASQLAEWLYRVDAAGFHEMSAGIVSLESMPEHARMSLEARLNALEEEEAQAPVHRIHFLRTGWRKFAAAAVLLLIAGSAYFLITKDGRTSVKQVAYKGDVAPGKEGSRLKLSDGRIVMIDTLKEGLIAIDGKIKVLKKDGKIVYEGSTDQIVYNEIFADKGQLSSPVELPDGTVAWLNAASSIRYPLNFAKEERKVEMTGEVSFKVVHNASQPFRVYVNSAKGKNIVEDVGTEFNINAYDDEPVVRTSLIEGTASVSNQQSKKIVKAGEQAISKGNDITVGAADVITAIAWRKNIFSFSHADVATIMRQFARWYDVEIKYEQGVPDETFTGDMGRDLTLKQVLEGLRGLRVHFRIEEDKRIVILP